MLTPGIHIPTGQLLVAICLTCATVFQLVLQFQELWYQAGTHRGPDWDFEEIRRRRVRRNVQLFAILEPLVDELKHASFLKRLPLADAEKALRRRATDVPWTVEEFAAFAVIVATAFSAVIGVLVAGLTSSVTGAATALFVLILGTRTQFRSLSGTAQKRVHEIRQRLPFAVDLMAMTMQAGSGITDALEATITDLPEHPLSQELRQILEDYRRGLSLDEAFAGMDQRLQHAEIHELIRSIETSRRLGTPVAQIFSSLATQMRMRKLQGAEAAAGEAQVRMHGPVLIIMVASMLAAVFPFIFQFWNNW